MAKLSLPNILETATDSVSRAVETVSETFESISHNKTVTSVLGTVLALFLILYASLAAPKLPKSVADIFDNMWIKLTFMFIIAYVSTKDMMVALMASVALLVTLQAISAHRTSKAVVSQVKTKVEEAFANNEHKDHEDSEDSEDSEDHTDHNNHVEPETHNTNVHNDTANVHHEIVGHDTGSYAEISTSNVIMDPEQRMESQQVSHQVAHQVAHQVVPEQGVPHQGVPQQVVLQQCGGAVDMTGYDGGELANF
jgi:hypothetical protein